VRYLFKLLRPFSCMPSLNEQRIRSITQLYYSKPEIQKAIFEFSKNREISPRYFEGFGTRPDMFQYPSDMFELVKKGATSFHGSEELWRDPLDISTDMDEKQYDELRIGWDLLLDIDSKYLDYSTIMAVLIIKMLKFHGMKNIGVKFSGSKGFHLIVPWKAFPKEVNGMKTSDMFPDWPRIITKYIMHTIQDELITRVSDLSRPNKYVKDFEAPKEVMPDLVLVSPRHLFRMPYSLHEKTALSSVVLDAEKVKDFHPRDADPFKVPVKDFMPDCQEGEASELLMQALDWYKEDKPEKQEGKREFKQIQIQNLSEKNFPPCVKKILQGLVDGKKRSLFVLLNLFRSVGMEKDEVEKQIEEWNKKNKPPLKSGYLKSQFSWSFRKKSIMPPNCQEFYKGIGVCEPDNLCKLIKNPVNYVVRKSFQGNKEIKKPRKKSEDKDNKF
jgi:DNA primase catalytic subunit